MLSVYCDGSSSGGGGFGPGGYGWIIVRGEKVLRWGCGGSPATTNNLQEAEAAIQGLSALGGLRLPQENVELVSDSQYTLCIANRVYHPSANLEQARKLIQAADTVGVYRFRWVKGHSGDQFNELCDFLAKSGKMDHTPEDMKPAKTKKSLRRERRKGVRDATSSKGSGSSGQPGDS